MKKKTNKTFDSVLQETSVFLEDAEFRIECPNTPTGAIRPDLQIIRRFLLTFDKNYRFKAINPLRGNRIKKRELSWDDVWNDRYGVSEWDLFAYINPMQKMVVGTKEIHVKTGFFLPVVNYDKRGRKFFSKTPIVRKLTVDDERWLEDPNSNELRLFRIDLDRTPFSDSQKLISWMIANRLKSRPLWIIKTSQSHDLSQTGWHIIFRGESDLQHTIYEKLSEWADKHASLETIAMCRVPGSFNYNKWSIVTYEAFKWPENNDSLVEDVYSEELSAKPEEDLPVEASKVSETKRALSSETKKELRRTSERVRQRLLPILKGILPKMRIGKVAYYLAKKNTGLSRGTERISQVYLANHLNASQSQVSSIIKKLVTCNILIVVRKEILKSKCRTYAWHPSIIEKLGALANPFCDIADGDYYPKGQSNEMAMADARACIAHGYSEEKAIDFIRKRCHSGSNRWHSIPATVRNAYAKHECGNLGVSRNYHNQKAIDVYSRRPNPPKVVFQPFELTNSPKEPAPVPQIDDEPNWRTETDTRTKLEVSPNVGGKIEDERSYFKPPIIPLTDEDHLIIDFCEKSWEKEKKFIAHQLKIGGSGAISIFDKWLIRDEIKAAKVLQDEYDYQQEVKRKKLIDQMAKPIFSVDIEEPSDALDFLYQQNLAFQVINRLPPTLLVNKVLLKINGSPYKTFKILAPVNLIDGLVTLEISVIGSNVVFNIKGKQPFSNESLNQIGGVLLSGLAISAHIAIGYDLYLRVFESCYPNNEVRGHFDYFRVDPEDWLDSIKPKPALMLAQMNCELTDNIY